MGRLRAEAGMVALLSLAGIAAAATKVRGVVTSRDGQRIRPLPRVTVVASQVGGGDVLASTKTDSQGRYWLADLSSSRVSLRVQRTGYFTVRAGGHEDERVVLDCSQPQDCLGVDFELAPAAVITGRVVDDLGEPLQHVTILARRSDDTTGQSGVQAMTGTDDRGLFRVAGLRPGSYVLNASIRFRRIPSGVSSIVSSPAEVSSPLIEVESGDEIHGVEITLPERAVSGETFHVAGRLSGMDLSKRGAHFVSIRGPGSRVGVSVTKTGTFDFNVGAGEYTFHYEYRPNRYDRQGAESQSLGSVRVDRDIESLVLRPMPPTGFRGKLTFDSDRLAEATYLRLSAENRRYADSIHAEPPGFEFKNTGILPGRYRLTPGRWLRQNQVFIKEIRLDGELVAADAIDITQGRVSELKVIVSTEFANIYGRIKAGREGDRIIEGAQYRVGLESSDDTQIAQTDQYGRFLFDKVAPGNYRICAWKDLSPQQIRRDETWEKAGDAVRAFPVEAGSEIEIDLTAAER